MGGRAEMAAAILAEVARNEAVIDEAERALPTEQTLEIIAAVLWLNGCRADATAQVYARERLAQALGRPLVASFDGF